MTISPLIVLGIHRSGTTWLANQLGQHPLIAAVSHQNHWGVHESAFFHFWEGRFGDLRNRTSFIEFIEVIAATDYFRLAGADREFLYSLWPSDYAQIFRQVMDRFAITQGARFWLEKTPRHTLQACRLAETFDDARFIVIRRAPEAVAISHQHFGRIADQKPAAGQLATFRLGLAWGAYNRAMDRLQDRYADRVVSVAYEDLKADPENVYRSLCAFLGITFEPAMLDSAFQKNSSFDVNCLKPELTTIQRSLVKIGVSIGTHLPLILKSNIRSRNTAPADKYFRMHPGVPDKAQS